VNDSFSITPNYGTSRSGQEQLIPLAPKVGVITLVTYSSNTKFIPSLSCYKSYVTKCDQNTGTVPIKDPDNYCFVVWNSGMDSQYVNVSLSFNESVFNSNFTSPNKQGGNDIPIDDNNNSSNTDNRLINIYFLTNILIISNLIYLFSNFLTI